MDPKLQQYFAEKAAQERQQRQRQRDELLIREGLYHTVYAGPEDDPDQFEIDVDHPDRPRYKRVPISVTEDEYQRICELARGGKPCDSVFWQVTTVQALRYIAYVIYGVGFLQGILIGEQSMDQGFLLTMQSWLRYLVSGSLVLGMSEIAKQLSEKK